MAITALNGNQMFERITLLFMEQVRFLILTIPLINTHYLLFGSVCPLSIISFQSD